LGVDELVAIPDPQRFPSSFVLITIVVVLNTEPEGLYSVDKVLVDRDEYRCTELNGLRYVAKDIDGGAAAADVVVSLEDGDVEGFVRGEGVTGGVEGEVVCC